MTSCRTMRTRGPLAWSVLAVAVASLVARPSDAEERASTASQFEPSSAASSSNTPAEQALAREWGLKNEEWSRYRQLMRGPLGVYSPNLDPLTALGIEARTEDERRRYAELQVVAEGRRAEKLFAYQRAYDSAWRKLYPGLPRIGESASRNATRPAASLGSDVTSDRLAVFVKDACAACDERARQLQSAGRRFDVYVVGSKQDDTLVRQWATRVGIDPEKVRSGEITLNHDAGRWLALGEQGSLPAVLTQVSGQWQRD